MPPRAEMTRNEKRLSLCVITGNAEKYVDRFLDSFQPHVDEVVMVRAIGDNDPDKTLQIASERGCKVDEYFNAWGNKWPHVDDFAAARNKAFDMATGDFVMWADMDDILEAGERIRADIEAMPDECLALSVPYDVRDDQLRIMRERIIRRGAARWINQVHEQLDFPHGVKVAETNIWQVVHVPIGKRTANDDRNVRILESIANPTGSQRFHLVQSLRAVGRIEDAIKLAASIVSNPPQDLGKPELYELFFTMAQLAEDTDTRARLMLQALATDPTRREAYGDLAMSYLSQGENKAALALAEAMTALKLPEPPPWNIRRKYYGYAAPLILGATLRASGDVKKADVLETNHFVRSGAKISLLHATRGRPDKAAACRRMWMERASNPDAVEHIFGLDICDESAFLLAIHRHVFVRGNGGPVDAWNECAKASSGQVLVQLSDDWIPPLGWDEMIFREIGDTSKPAVLAINDGNRKDDLLCMAIVTRKRWHDQGYMFHPEFFSMFSDNWFSECAWKDGVVIDARERITFEHLHPAFGKAEMDETYARTNADYHYKTGEGILKRLREGVKVSADIEGWFDFRDVYDYVAQTIDADGEFVEVGSWKGKSAVYLRDMTTDIGKRSARILCVDTFEGDGETGKRGVFSEFLNNTIGRGISHLPISSIEAADRIPDGELDGVFIDAAHDYESVKADIEAWRPKVKQGGFFGGHDIDKPDVRRVLDDLGIKYKRIGRCWIQTTDNQ